MLPRSPMPAPALPSRVPCRRFVEGLADHLADATGPIGRRAASGIRAVDLPADMDRNENGGVARHALDLVLNQGCKGLIPGPREVAVRPVLDLVAIFIPDGPVIEAIAV